MEVIPNRKTLQVLLFWAGLCWAKKSGFFHYVEPKKIHFRDFRNPDLTGFWENFRFHRIPGQHNFASRAMIEKNPDFQEFWLNIILKLMKISQKQCVADNDWKNPDFQEFRLNIILKILNFEKIMLSLKKSTFDVFELKKSTFRKSLAQHNPAQNNRTCRVFVSSAAEILFRTQDL